jgi:hypothetical protein
MMQAGDGGIYPAPGEFITPREITSRVSFAEAYLQNSTVAAQDSGSVFWEWMYLSSSLRPPSKEIPSPSGPGLRHLAKGD